jgi:serine protein kinase
VTRGRLGEVVESVRARFGAQRHVLSFSDFLALVEADPERYSRDAARYVLDAVEHFGSYDVERAWGAQRRYRVFDLVFREGGEPEPNGRRRRSDHLQGHERVQEAVVRGLRAFAREGRSNRLVLLHGPNGSAKSTLVACLMRGVEAYSETDEGALYRFSWVFPTGSDGKGIGFLPERSDGAAEESYAHLPEERIQVKISPALRDHPLLLIPRDERRRLLSASYERAGSRASPPDLLWDGQLSHENQQIYEALLRAYRGDLARVLAHVQVEREYFSRRYRRGLVTVGPEMAVDAHERQITADQSLGRLPASLSALTLFEAMGDLVDGRGGILEFSDLLKRPLDAWRYLLLAIETGDVSLRTSQVTIDSVLLATSNDLHLNAFRAHPEFLSFQGRLTFVRVPYLLDVEAERGIYESQIVPQLGVDVAPHTIYVAALWAVLTRLHRPRRENYRDAKLGLLASTLSPYEKIRLTTYGEIPERFDESEAKVLAANIRVVVEEHDDGPLYEGTIGASPRELRALLLGTATRCERGVITPLEVLDALDDFCRAGDYEFLKRNPDGGYYAHEDFVDVAREAWLDRVEEELRNASGLFDVGRPGELFARYVIHASHAEKGERVFNPVTGRYEVSDVELMRRVEEAITDVGGADFRKDLISRVASYAIDHPGEEVDYGKVFPDLLKRLAASYYREHRAQLAETAQAVVARLDHHDKGLEPELRERADAAIRTMREVHGYGEHALIVALQELLSRRLVETS